MVKNLLLLVLITGCAGRRLPPVDCAPPALPSRPALSAPLPPTVTPGAIVEACADDLRLVGAYCIALENILNAY